MTAHVALHLTDSRVWVRYGREEWDGPVAMDDAAQVQMAPAWFVDSGYCATPGRAVPIAESLGRILRDAIGEVGCRPPAELVVATYPTNWGTARLNVLATAVRSFANEAEFVPIAVAAARAAAVRAKCATDANIVVLEIGAMTTVASCVGQASGEGRVVACELITDIGLADYSERRDELVEVVDTVIGSRRVDALVIVGDLVATDIEALSAALSRRSSVEFLAARDLVRHVGRPIVSEPQIARPEPVRNVDWLAAAPADRAASRGSPRSARRVRTLAAAALVAVVAVGAGVAFASSREDRHLDTAEPAATPTTDTDVGELTLGRIRVTIPDGWRITSSEPQQPGQLPRLELVPISGPERRITVTQYVIRSDLDLEGIANVLRRKVDESPNGANYEGIEADVVFAGRHGVTFRENPDGRSQVRWHVMVDRDTQVGVGCQGLFGEWDALSGDCEQVVSSVVISP